MNNIFSRVQDFKDKHFKHEKSVKKEIEAKRHPAIMKNIRDILSAGVEMFGDHPLYVFKRNGQENRVTYREFRDMVNYVGTGFSNYGLMGKTVAVIGDCCPEYLATYHAAVAGNGVIVPIDHDLSEEAIVGFLNWSEAEAIVYTEAFNGKLLKLADQLSTVKYFIPAYGETQEGDNILPMSTLIECGRRALKKGDRSFIDCKPIMEKMSVLLFTSGTTGTSKGVMLSHRNLIAAINASVQSTEYDDDDVLVDLLPLHHSYEMTCGQLAASACGMTIYVNDGIKNTMRTINAAKPTLLVVVPLYIETMRKRIWNEIDKKGMRKKVELAMKLSDTAMGVGLDLRDKIFAQIRNSLGGNLRSIVCGGAPLDPDLVREFDRFGIAIFEGYGITECAPLVAFNRAGKRRPGSVGQPVYGCMVRIDNGGGNEPGEILVKGDNVMMGYYKNEEATREVFTEDGWFKTGDIGYIDSDNYVYITGRKKNVIILSNGKNVFPEELEEHLSREDIVSETVVVARKKYQSEDVVITAIIYPDPELTKGMSSDEEFAAVKEAVNRVNKKLPVYKQIHDIEIRDTEFEKTTTKKIKRFLVK
jgi:long-chain acyl-CoA synthetase